MARTLDVYLHRHRVGSLIQDDHGEIRFEYAAAWVHHPDAIPLSQSLPLRNELAHDRLHQISATRGRQASTRSRPYAA